MNNEQKTLLRLLQVKLKVELGQIGRENALDQMIYFLSEFERLEA